MKRVVSLLFIVVLLCSLFNCNVFADDSIIYYSFTDDLSAGEFEKILGLYNNTFGYDTVTEFKMGKNSEEYVFASFDKEGITLYPENFYNSKIDEEDKKIYIRVFLDYLKSSYIDLDALHMAFSDFMEEDENIGALILPMIMGSTYVQPYKLFLFNHKWLNIVIIGLPIILFIMFLLYLIRNKKKFIEDRKKYIAYLVFFILFVFYFYFINFIFII